MSAPLIPGAASAWRWFAQALVIGLLSIVTGGAIGLVLSRGSFTAAAAVGGVGALVAWVVTVQRLGRVSIVAGLFVGGAALSGARVGEVAWPLRGVEVVPIATLSRWPRGARAVRLPTALRPLPDFAETVHWQRRSPRGTVDFAYSAVPLAAVEGGPVVAFACAAPGGHHTDDSAVLSVVGVDAPRCAWAAAGARRRIEAAGRAVAPDAGTRLVTAHRDEDALRSSHHAGFALGMWTSIFALYALALAAHAATRRRA
jgi:hypothetical protein